MQYNEICRARELILNFPCGEAYTPNSELSQNSLNFQDSSFCGYSKGILLKCASYLSYVAVLTLMGTQIFFDEQLEKEIETAV